MATAAVVDAGRKDRRRRELDDNIAEARSSLAGLLEQSAGQDLAKILSSPYPDVPYSRPLERLDVLRDICKLEAGFLQDLQKKRRDRFKTAQNIREALGLPWNPELPDTRKTTLARCEEVITAEKEWDLERREPQTEIHMDKVTDMITDLVDRLMAEAWWVTELEAPGSHPALVSPDSANTMIRMLRSDGYPCYTHPDLAPTSTVIQRERLNEVNVQILSDWSPPFRERYVAKICYNLLVCGVTPGIQNYNMLMFGLSFVGEHHLSQAVADSFLFLSHMRPTEATYLCLLHHFRLKGDVVGFQSIIKRMFGWDVRGIGLMRRTADYVERFPELRAWAAGDVAEVGGHFVQRAPFTQNVAEAILEGLVDFNMLREGAKLVAVCLREQWTVSRDLMWRLFHSCLTLLDSVAAKMLIRGLLDNIDQTSLMLLGPEAVGPGLVRQLRHLLNIWQATAPPGINVVGHAGLRSDNSMGEVEEARLRHLATAIWIREMWHHSSMMVWWLRRTDRKLLDRGTPLIERLDMVLSVLNFAAERPRLKMEKSMYIQRIAKVDWLVTQTVSTDFHIRQAEHAILKVANKKVPRPLWKFPLVPTRLANKQRSLDKPIRGAMLYDTPGTLENNVALCFHVSAELDYRIKRLLVYALPRMYAKKLERSQNDSGDVSLERILAYFYHYLASAKHREERALGMVTRPDPFSQLLLDVPDRPSFWNKNTVPAEAAAGTTASPERPDW